MAKREVSFGVVGSHCGLPTFSAARRAWPPTQVSGPRRTHRTWPPGAASHTDPQDGTQTKRPGTES